MKEYKVEYLIILKNQGSFCNSIKSFNNLLKANDEIEIKSNKLEYKSLEINFENKTGVVTDKEQRFFNLTLTLTKTEKLEDFIDLLKVLREIIYKSGGNINVIWDDISFYYSTLSYPIINRIENLLRKLITKFMLTSVGFDWEQETLPDDVKSVVSKSKRAKNGYVNILHETDFIHLADFLFKPYYKKSIDELFKMIKTSKTIEEIDFNQLKEFVPRSNWEKYFSSIVNCEDGFLNKKWNRLYELRCLVAHNNFITSNEYDEIEEITNSLQKTFEEALNNLDKIKIDIDDKDILLESVVRNKNESYGEFLNKWKILEFELHNSLSLITDKTFDLTIKFGGPVKKAKALLEYNIIDKNLYNEILFLISLRNSIVHKPDIELNNFDLINIIELVNSNIKYLRKLRIEE
jgi:hypothetical protein